MIDNNIKPNCMAAAAGAVADKKMRPVMASDSICFEVSLPCLDNMSAP